MKRSLLFVMIMVIAALQMHAAVTFSVRPPSRVFEGEKFAVTFRLENAEARDIKVSQING